MVTDNGSCYRSNAFARATGHAGRHQLIKPFTPKHNGKIERYQRILTEELLTPSHPPEMQIGHTR